MDSMLHKLEKYADNLESIVEQRTSELMDEKQKTDMLLHRMLPTWAVFPVVLVNHSAYIHSGRQTAIILENNYMYRFEYKKPSCR